MDSQGSGFGQSPYPSQQPSTQSSTQSSPFVPQQQQQQQQYQQQQYQQQQYQQPPYQQQQQHQHGQYILLHMDVDGTVASTTVNNMAELAPQPPPFWPQSLSSPRRPPSIKRPGSGLSLSLSFTSSNGSGRGHSPSSGSGADNNNNNNDDDQEPLMDEFLFDNICADFEEIVIDDLYQSVSVSLGVEYLSDASHILVPLPIIQGAVVSASMRPFVSMAVKMDRPKGVSDDLSIQQQQQQQQQQQRQKQYDQHMLQLPQFLLPPPPPLPRPPPPPLQQQQHHPSQPTLDESSPFFYTTLDDADQFNLDSFPFPSSPSSSLYSSSAASSSISPAYPMYQPRNVHFLYMAACPQTYLSLHAVRALMGGDENTLYQQDMPFIPPPQPPPPSRCRRRRHRRRQDHDDNDGDDDDDDDNDGLSSTSTPPPPPFFSDPAPIPLIINGYPVQAYLSPAESHFSHLNILGQSFLRATGASVIMAAGNQPLPVFSFPI
ncbi:hypothetical protein DFQ27_006455 [Actinomortierella ambigua]|uniref:Uncharacterized protein n=1 Tax=Actinomortierella ambigua TaxID=1343610 RepID=A0A9P6QJB0_9FUNG|nr:hypothetical protein DFQ27_006455 [Actinomortierella ambigua]